MAGSSAGLDSVTTRIENIGADGDGVGTYLDGLKLYVPFTVPGDLVQVSAPVRRGDAWSATLETLIESGLGRQTPVCQHFGDCGGCTSQHWDEAAYLDWKLARLTGALRRAGFADPPVAPIVLGQPASRRRMDLAARRIQGGMTLGLHPMRGGGGIIDLRECPVLHPALSELLAPLRPLLTSLSAIRRDASVIVNLLDSGPDLLLRTDGDLVMTDRTKLTAFATAHGLTRVSWAEGTGETEAVCILRPPVMTFSAVPVSPPPGAILQATRDGEAAITAAVIGGLPKKRTAKARVLELFAGCGTITFALSAHMRVLAIEGGEPLVSACHDAINRSGLMGKVEVKRRDLARQPFLAKELAAFTAVVLDPPHAGAAAQMPHIAAAKVPTVIYVSCDPASLGRDAAVLARAGYRLEKVTPIDQFLWSARLEAVAVFRIGR